MSCSFNIDFSDKSGKVWAVQKVVQYRYGGTCVVRKILVAMFVLAILAAANAPAARGCTVIETRSFHFYYNGTLYTVVSSGNRMLGRFEFTLEGQPAVLDLRAGVVKDMAVTLRVGEAVRLKGEAHLMKPGLDSPVVISWDGEHRSTKNIAEELRKRSEANRTISVEP